MKRTTFLPVLVALATAAALITLPVRAANPRVIEIHAQRFAFAPNVITVKSGETVRLKLVTQDVTHGFFSRALNLDEVIAPDQPAEITLTAPAPGKYPIICDHFCGQGHGNMALTLVVEP